MGLYNYERIAERLLRKLESLDPNSNEYKLTLYAYKKTIDQQPTHKNRQNVEDYLSLKRMSELAPIQESDYSNYPSMPSHGGPASGGEPVPPDIARAENIGETVGERAVSAYKAASVQNYSYPEFSAALKRILAGAEQEKSGGEEFSSHIYTNDPDSLERIRQQALLKGSGGGDLVFGDPNAEENLLMGGRGAEWPYEVSRSTRPTGRSVPGGTFSVGGGVTGGDTEESLRAYVDNYRNTEVDRQIGLIEQAFPAAYRPPALDARLQDLYTARANRDQQETARQRLPIDARLAEAEYKQAEGLYEYHTNYGPTQKYVADRGVDEAKITAGAREQSDMRYYFDDLLQRVREAAKTNPAMDSALSKITAIAYDPKLDWNEKNRRIEEELRRATTGSSGQIDLSEQESLLFNKPGG